MKFLQPFSIDSAGFPWRDAVIPSPRSFHGVKICSVLFSFCTLDSFLAGLVWAEIKCTLQTANEPVQQSRQQSQSAYCPNMYTVL